MGTKVLLTRGPTRITSTTTLLIKDGVIDVLAFKSLDLWIQVYEASGPAPQVTLTIDTSMQNTSDDAALWKTVATFSTLTAANTIDVQSVNSGLLQFVRWKVTLGANTTASTFEIQGVARPG